jgi:predicted dehydrogenase
MSTDPRPVAAITPTADSNRLSLPTSLLGHLPVPSDVVRVGIIGYGYWGPNLARNFHTSLGSRVVAICDQRSDALRRAGQEYPRARLTTDMAELMVSPQVDAIAVATPVWTHFEIAKAALTAGKHVFVEKPFTARSAQAEELIDLAQAKRLTIMVDHTFLFTGAVKKIRSLIEDDSLGRLYYYDSTRVNLGLFQHDVNVIWDLAPHDLSIMDYLISDKPQGVVATGERHLNGVEDVAFITIYFPRNIIAHINVNWLSPVKVRTTLIGGEKKMLVWNDLEADEKLRIYDKGVDMGSSGVYELLVSYRSGDMWAPKVERLEALRCEAEYFVECIRKTINPINNGEAGLRIVRLLEAADESLKERGKIVYL